MALMPKNGVLIEVENNSNHNFILDGEWLKHGDWRSDRWTVIGAHATTELHFAAGRTGFSGVIWWVDELKRDTYLSMAVSNPRMQTSLTPATFACFAGLPPANLKAELKIARRLVQGEEVLDGDDGCRWVAEEVGAADTVIRVCIYPNLPRYVPLTMASPSAPVENCGGASAQHTSAPEAALLLQSVGEHGSQDLANFMSRTRPKDLQDGVKRGLKTAVTALGFGLATPVAATVRGARESGVLGGLKGFGLGVLGGAAFIAGGATAGAIQIGRGAKHQPEAFFGRRKERVYDQELGRWMDVDLCELEREVMLEEESEDEASEFSSRPVQDTQYYDLLGVPTDATAEKIKRAYYRQARECHPDKCPGDPAATQKFQRLAQAYQVLADPQERKRYDSQGLAGLEDKEMRMDPTIFFSLLFGSEQFIRYTGELHLAMALDHLSKSVEEMKDEALEHDACLNKPMEKRQKRREVHLACFLRNRLDKFVYGRDESGFSDDVRQEASRLAAGRFGPELLRALGEAYQIRAELHLANELVGRFSVTKRVAALRRTAKMLDHRWHLCTGVTSSLLRVKRISDAVHREEDRQHEGQFGHTGLGEAEDALESSLPTFLQTAWSAVVRDIDVTVLNVGRMLMQDKSVPWQVRIRRAQALRVLGEVFAQEGARAEAAQGGPQVDGMTSEVTKTILMESLMGSAREVHHNDRT